MPDLSWEFSLAWAGAEPAKCRFTHRSVGRAVVSVQCRAQKSRPWDWVERTEITLRKKQHPQDLRPGKSRICIAGGSAGVLQNSGQNSPRGGRNNGARAGHISRFQTADLVPAARFAPGFCILASQPRMKGWRSAESRYGCSDTRGPAHDAAGQAPGEAPCVSRRRPPLGARTVAILGGGAALASPAFMPERKLLAPGFVVPGRAVPCLPGRAVPSPRAAGRHASLRPQDRL